MNKGNIEKKETVVQEKILLTDHKLKVHVKYQRHPREHRHR